MSSSFSPTQRLEKLFFRRSCWLLADLAHNLGYALISVRLFLKQIGYCRSYTHNGMWYTLRSTPRFNRDGIWHHKDIGFSKHGSLIATIGYLVGRSPAGLSAGQLAQRLQHPHLPVLTNLHKNGTLDRVKLGGKFRYLSTVPETNRRQREQAAAAEPPSGSLSTHAAVLVLVEHVRHPELDFAQLAASVRRRDALSVAPEAIRRFFEEQGLKKNPE